MKNILIIYFILSTCVALGQNKEIDSLQQALKNYNAKKLELNKDLNPDESDTLKADILNNLGQQFFIVSDYALARKYADEAMAIAQKLKYQKGISQSYSSIGIIYWYQGDYQEALKNQFASLEIRQEIGDKTGIALSHGNIGTIYGQQGNYPEALKNYFAALKILEETAMDKNRIATTYSNIGVVYEAQGNYPEALKYFNSSLKIFEETANKNGIGLCHNNIGVIFKSQGNYPEALKNTFAALKISEEMGDKQSFAFYEYNIGNIYFLQGDYTEALKYQFAAIKGFEEVGDKNGIAGSSISIGNNKLKLHAARDGREWLMKGLILAKEIGSLENIKLGYEGLTAADSALGNFNGAYENHKLFMLYRDSLSNEEATKKSLQTKMQYEFDKKEAETKTLTDAELNKQKLLRNGFVGGFAVVLLFAGVLFRQRNKTKKEKQRSDELLLNILPGEVADEIKTSGTARAKAFTMVTVMFTDFKDFTTMSEKISAELLVDEIHTCFSAFDNILDKYKIEKIKTIGDAYLCASGLPVSTRTHASDMLKAAFEIRDYMLRRKKEKEERGEIAFDLRIGIHTGPVVAGVVGVKKYAYDIWGDTVNIAARMEQTSEAGKINISGTTYELVKDMPLTSGIKFEPRGKIQAKNKGEIAMYFAES